MHTVLSFTCMSLICFMRGDFSSDGVFFLKEESRLCAAGKCMSHPAGWAAHSRLWCCAIWTALLRLTGSILSFLLQYIYIQFPNLWSLKYSYLFCVNEWVTMVKHGPVLHKCVKLLHFSKLSIFYVCFSCTHGCGCCWSLSLHCLMAIADLHLEKSLVYCRAIWKDKPFPLIL